MFAFCQAQISCSSVSSSTIPRSSIHAITSASQASSIPGVCPRIPIAAAALEAFTVWITAAVARTFIAERDKGVRRPTLLFTGWSKFCPLKSPDRIRLQSDSIADHTMDWGPSLLNFVGRILHRHATPYEYSKSNIGALMQLCPPEVLSCMTSSPLCFHLHLSYMGRFLHHIELTSLSRIHTPFKPIGAPRNASPAVRSVRWRFNPVLSTSTKEFLLQIAARSQSPSLSDQLITHQIEM